MSSGWIKLHRSLVENWVFQRPDYLKAWVTILLEVNHAPQKQLIKTKLLFCDRGESIKSLETWGRLFGNWDKSKVRRFFNLLESDSMIATKSETITTRLTVCNYEQYQESRNADETQVKRKRNADETQLTPNKKDKNDKKVKKKQTRALFSAPVLSDVVTYCKERKNDVNPETWHDYYTSNGWMVGKNKMKDWKAAVRTWEKNDYGGQNGTSRKSSGKSGFANARKSGETNWLE